MNWTRTFKKCRVENLYNKWNFSCSSCSSCSSLTIQDESSSNSSCSSCSFLTIQDELSSNHVISRCVRFYVKKWACRAIIYLFDSNRNLSLLTFDWIVTLFFLLNFLRLEEIHSLSCFMFFFKSQARLVLVARVFKKKIDVMMFCTRCARDQKKCHLSFLSRKCEKCIRVEKKCEFTKSMIHFDNIDKTIKKLKREKLKIEVAWEIANELARSKLSKLKRLREQKCFLKEREQKMFDNALNDIKELKRLKELKKTFEMIVDFENLNDFFASSVLSFDATNWISLENSFDNENVVESFDNF